MTAYAICNYRLPEGPHDDVMSAPVRPEPDNWLLDDFRRRVQPPAPGQRSPFAPSDVTRTPIDVQRDASPTGRISLRQIAAGLAGSPARLVAGLGQLLTPDGSQELVTVGRGEVRSRPGPGPGVVRRGVDALYQGGDDLTDIVGGGPAQDEFAESDRMIGDLAGNVVLGEGLFRIPQVVRARRAVPTPTPRGRIVREVPRTEIRTADAHPLELPPFADYGSAEAQAWTRQQVNRRMGRPEGTGAPRGNANASGQELFDQHLRRVGLLDDAPAAGLVDDAPLPPAPVAAQPAVGSEHIASASVRAHDGRVFTGANHGDAFNAAKAAGLHPDDFEGLEEGFSTNAGRFVSREEGYRIAKAAKQKPKRLQYGPDLERIPRNINQLKSEGLLLPPAPVATPAAKTGLLDR